MRAKIEIYNDRGDLVGKYEAPPYIKRIDYDGEYVPIKQEESKK